LLGRVPGVNYSSFRASGHWRLLHEARRIAVVNPPQTGSDSTAEDGRSIPHSYLQPLETDFLQELERTFDLSQPELVSDQIEIVGAGEVSAVFTVMPAARSSWQRSVSTGDVVCKRLPLFRGRSEAEAYARTVDRYVAMLQDAGIRVVDQATSVVEVPGRPVIVYIQQRRLPTESFGDSIVKRGSPSVALRFANRVADQCEKVFRWNQGAPADREVSIDGHLANWAMPDEGGTPVFVDTGTPVYRLKGDEQFDPRIYLRHAPKILRAGAMMFAAKSLLPRYYDRRSVFLDLAANLRRVGRGDLLPGIVKSLNRRLDGNPLRVGEAVRYFHTDILVWNLYHGIRRIDRLVTRHFRGKRYEFYIPPSSRKRLASRRSNSI
jgi:hypothetical protein